MKKTLVKGLVALAAGALLAGGLLGCEQAVDPIDSITVKPSSLGSANVKAVQAPGFFALTWDRVKNCAGYEIEMKNVATGEVSTEASNLDVTTTSWYSSWPVYPQEGERYEYEYTVIAKSNLASGRAATTVQNSYSSVRVVFEPVPDDYAKPAVPSDVEATLEYKPLVDGKKTTTGTLSVSFTAKAGVYYALVKDSDLPLLSVVDNEVVFNPMSAIIPLTADPVIRDTKVNFDVEVEDVTPGAEYSYTLAAFYKAYTKSGDLLYSTKTLKAPAVEDVDSGFMVSTNQPSSDPVKINVRWNKAYGGSVEYVQLAEGIQYTPGMTGKEIYDSIKGVKYDLKAVSETVVNGTIVRNGTIEIGSLLKDDTKYVLVILQKDDVYEMRTVTIKAPEEQRAKFEGSTMTIDVSGDRSSNPNYGKVDVHVKLNGGATVGSWKAEGNYWVEVVKIETCEYVGGDTAQFPVQVTDSGSQTAKPDDDTATEYTSTGIDLTSMTEEIIDAFRQGDPTYTLVLTYGENLNRKLVTNDFTVKWW